MSFADALNDQTLKLKALQFERDFERSILDRANAYHNEIFGAFGWKDMIGKDYRNITSAGLSGEQFKLLSFMSAGVTSLFDIARNSGILSITRQLHGNIGLGISQRDANDLMNIRMFSNGRIQPTNPFGNIGAKANRLGGISISRGARGKSSKHGGRRDQRDLLETVADVFHISGGSRSITGSTLLAQQAMTILREEGEEIPNFMNYGVLVGGPRGGAVDFDQARYNRDFMAAMDRANAKRQARENIILNFMSRTGLSRSEVIDLQSTQQGTDDLYGMIDFRERMARASTGTG